ncbi:YgiW/YdeI family stress tolerance OB fold protein [Pandoraea norimbergensis]|uniref:Bacterial OB-fold domain-containing protein n=1 Tax=Pandoraea norimbergensis TaxID=93219 RepID=A0ABM5WM22_9BURK|nr:NirD/YgiW/YdeI family stress tolerance protein [Pandoraea norimbergensis]
MSVQKTRFAMLLASAAALGALSATPAIAQYTGPGAPPAAAVAVPSVMPSVVSVQQALSAPDDSQAVIEGFIVNRIKHEHYTFRDDAGHTIEIELDDKYLPPGVKIDDKTRVRITGEVDRHRHRPSDIDVKRLEIIR